MPCTLPLTLSQPNKNTGDKAMTFLVKHQAISPQYSGQQLAMLPSDFPMMARQMQAPAGETMSIDFRSVFIALLRRKWWLIVPVLLAMVGGLAGALTLVPRYSAGAQVLVDPREIQLVRPDASLRSQVPEMSSSLAENALVLMRSSTLLKRVVEIENLTEDPEFVGKPGYFGKPMDESVEARKLRAFMALEKRVATRRAERSSVIEVWVSTENAVKSARLANSLAAAFLELQSGSDSETAQRATTAVSSRLEELSARVQKADSDVQDYKARNNLQTANGKLVNEQQLQELNSQLILAQTRTSDARSKYESVRKLSLAAIERGDLPDTANSAVIGQLRLKYAEASRLEADAKTKLGSKHPEMAAITAQVRDVRALISDEMTRISRTAQADFERARASEESLSRTLDQLKSQSSDTSGASVRLRELERQADASREIYSSYLKRARELGEQQGISTFNARIVSSASPPQYASGISKSMVLVGATFAGVMVGLMLALLAEQFDQTLRGRAQFQQASGLPVLAEMAGEGSRRRRLSQLTAHVVERPQSAFSLGACRVADAFAAESAPDHTRSVLFIGVSKDINLTEVVLNVSIAAAQATWRVLMVDANTSGSGISRHLDTEPAYGLADVVAQRCGLTSAILTDDRTEVRILPASARGKTNIAARRLSPQQVELQVLAPARGFELLFIDGGILGRDASALAFAAAVDDIVLVAAEGQTSKKAMREAVEFLGLVQNKLRGVVTA